MTLLIVDDHPGERELLTTMLQRGGYHTVQQASSAPEAFTLLGLDLTPPPPTTIELILLDLDMPGLNGLQACQRFKAAPITQHIPIVMVTASDDMTHLQAAFDAGAVDYITKPFKRAELLARVRLTLKLKQEQDERLEREKELREINAILREVLDLVKAEQAKSAELEKQKLRSDMEVDRHRSIAQMVAGVAHEINTPLGILNTAASLIKQRVQAEALQTSLKHNPQLSVVLDDLLEASGLIERNVTRAHKLVQDFKKVSVNQITDPLETVRIAEVVADTVGLFNITARQTRLAIEIKNTLPPDKQLWVGYPGSLSQVILNLLSNAQRYAYTEGGQVELGLAAEGADFVLTVRDFGAGIPPENLPKVFDAFFTTGRSKGGTGLGLTIVQNLVTSLMKGAISIVSEVGQGTTVVVRVPQVVTG